MTAVPLLDAALRFHSLGISVIPSVPRGKRGAIPWTRFQRRRADELQLRQWFGDVDNTQLGVAVVLGQVSDGLLVRDFDQQASYAAWKRAEPRLARLLPTVATARGSHVWFRSEAYKPPGARTYVHKFDDGELRGDGHIVIAPPSLHPRGKPYRWILEPVESIPLIDDFGVFGIPANGQCYTRMSVYQSGGDIPGKVLEAIEATLPTGAGQRDRRIFDFCRHLKAIDECRDKSADDLLPYLDLWFQAALPVIRTKDFAVTEKAFRRGWPLVERPAGGEGSIKRALARAVLAPPPPEAAQFRSAGLRSLVALCRELQRERGGKPFYLACRDAADVLGLTGHMSAWRSLNKLVHSGILRLERSGSQADRRANEYTYLGDLGETNSVC